MVEEKNNRSNQQEEAQSTIQDVIKELQNSELVEKNYRLTLGIFESLIESRLKHFVGRELIMNKINEFISSEDSGYLFIEGPPGIGKTAIISNFIKQNPNSIFHFNIASQGVNTVRQFLHSVKNQIAFKYSLDLPEVPISPDKYSSYLENILSKAANLEIKEKKLIIAIDALDEVDYRDVQHTLFRDNILSLPTELPDNLCIIVTGRHNNARMQTNSNVHTLNLISLLEKDVLNDDIRSFVKENINIDEDTISTVWKTDVEGFIDLIVSKSEGNFMYATHILREVTKGTYNDLNTLPIGLSAYYKDHFNRMNVKYDNEYFLKRIEIIYFLATAKTPVSLELLSTWSNIHIGEVNTIIKEWRQFLIEQHLDDGTVKWTIYHKSFADFLFRQEIMHYSGIDNLSKIQQRKLTGFGSRFGISFGGTEEEEQ